MKKLAGILLGCFLSAALLTGCGSSSTPNTASQNSSSKAQTNFDSSKDINVVSRENGSGTRGAFIELFKIEEKGADGSKKDLTTQEAIIANKTDVMMTNIASDPYAIGYISLGSLNNTVKALSIDGTPASAENIKNGSYKISRPFNIATKGEPSGLAKDFLDFVMSREGQQIVAKNYIPVDAGAAAFSGSKPAGKIVVAGSSSVTPVMEVLVEAYLALNKDANIEIQMSDSSAGMTGAINGTCDIGMASRDLKESELKELKDYVIALDGIAVIVNRENPNTNLTSEQVKQIFTGAATKWNALK